MNKIMFSLLLMIIIANVYTSSTSQCATSGENRRLSSESDEDCSELETSDPTTMKCIFSPSKGKCIEIDKEESECSFTTFSGQLATELTDADCEPLKTSNDNKYTCVASDDGKSCEEYEGSNGLKLSLAILCFLLFL